MNLTSSNSGLELLMLEKLFPVIGNRSATANGIFTLACHRNRLILLDQMKTWRRSIDQFCELVDWFLNLSTKQETNHKGTYSLAHGPDGLLGWAKLSPGLFLVLQKKKYNTTNEVLLIWTIAKIRKIYSYFHFVSTHLSWCFKCLRCACCV